MVLAVLASRRSVFNTVYRRLASDWSCALARQSDDSYSGVEKVPWRTIVCVMFRRTAVVYTFTICCAVATCTFEEARVSDLHAHKMCVCKSVCLKYMHLLCVSSARCMPRALYSSTSRQPESAASDDLVLAVHRAAQQSSSTSERA